MSKFEVVEDLEDFHSIDDKREDGDGSSVSVTGDGQKDVRRSCVFVAIANRELKRLESSMPEGRFVHRD